MLVERLLGELMRITPAFQPKLVEKNQALQRAARTSAPRQFKISHRCGGSGRAAGARPAGKMPMMDTALITHGIYAAAGGENPPCLSVIVKYHHLPSGSSRLLMR